MQPYRSPWMTSELGTFRDVVRRFVQQELAPHEETWRKQQHVDRAAWRKQLKEVEGSVELVAERLAAKQD